MDVSLSVSLDKPDLRRDFSYYSGDSFNVLLEIFSAQTSDVVFPNDMSASPNTLSMLIDEWFGAPGPQTIIGTKGPVSSFAFTPDDVSRCGDRSMYRIVMDTPAGARTTLCYGFMAIQGYVPDGLWLLGNDYGWWPR